MIQVNQLHFNNILTLHKKIEDYIKNKDHFFKSNLTYLIHGKTKLFQMLFYLSELLFEF